MCSYFTLIRQAAGLWLFKQLVFGFLSSWSLAFSPWAAAPKEPEGKKLKESSRSYPGKESSWSVAFSPWAAAT